MLFIAVGFNVCGVRSYKGYGVKQRLRNKIVNLLLD
jgi:hypothetical protein